MPIMSIDIRWKKRKGASRCWREAPFAQARRSRSYAPVICFILAWSNQTLFHLALVL